jgi:hypothetical protein
MSAAKTAPRRSMVSRPMARAVPGAGRLLGDGRQAGGGDHHLVQRIGRVVGRARVSGQGEEYGRGRGEE